MFIGDEDDYSSIGPKNGTLAFILDNEFFSAVVTLVSEKYTTYDLYKNGTKMTPTSATAGTKYYADIPKDGSTFMVKVEVDGVEKSYNTVLSYTSTNNINIDDLVEYLSTSEKYYYNTYFNLSTTDGKGRTTENQKTRTCLVFDIDKKDLNINELQELCNQAGLHLHYHLIVMSGNGYHVYVFIEPTDDLQAVEEVQRAIALRLKADLKATLKTQVMRVPNTFNIKDSNNKRKVYILHKEKRETIKRKTIEHFQKQLKFQNTNININKTFKNFGTCKRLDKYIEEGCEGESRHEVLLWIQNKGKQLNLTESQINIAKEKFNEKANMSDFEYQSKYVSNKANGHASCIGCNYKAECKIDNCYWYL